MMGFEPTTTGITIRGSTPELHPPQPKTGNVYIVNGVDDGI